MFCCCNNILCNIAITVRSLLSDEERELIGLCLPNTNKEERNYLPDPSISVTEDFSKICSADKNLKVLRQVNYFLLFCAWKPFSSTKQAHRKYIRTCWICFWVFSSTCLLLDMKHPKFSLIYILNFYFKNVAILYFFTI